MEARLTEDFNASAEIYGVIHSKFRTALNILFRMPGGGTRLITVITSGTKGIPDSITVTEKYFAQLMFLPIGSKVLCKNYEFYFDSIFEVLKGNIQCLRQSTIVINNMSNDSVGLPNLTSYLIELKNHFTESYFNDKDSVLSSEQRMRMVEDLQCFSKAWLEKDYTKMESILLKLTGRGIGLTPSCDDALIGIIAVYTGARLYAKSTAGITNQNLKAWIELIDIGSLTPFNRLLFNRTTDVSLKYLCCSQEERFSDVIIELVKAVFSDKEEDLRPYIYAVSLVGESSGRDMLFGMEIAYRELSKLLLF
jgi:hypothetical protein